MNAITEPFVDAADAGETPRLRAIETRTHRFVDAHAASSQCDYAGSITWW